MAQGPSEAAPEESSRADSFGLRPGLYIGDYSHNRQYGLYGHEALVLERRSFAIDADDGALRAFFGRGDATAPLSAAVSGLLARLHAAPPAHGRCTLLIGRKVTGDLHVPMGAATFVALLEPLEALATALEEGATPERPARIRTQKSADERVVRGWAGFGTLAFPGFQRPSWDPGWLVQLEDDDDGRRFAFVWTSMVHDCANLLTQVVAQSTAVFLGEDEGMRPYWPPAKPHTAD